MENQGKTEQPIEPHHDVPLVSFHWLNKGLFVSAIVFIIVLVGIGGYLLGKSKTQPSSQTQQQAANSPSVVQPSAPSNSTTNWKTYTSPKIGYSIKAPAAWTQTQTEDDTLLAHQDYVTNMTLSPVSQQGITGLSVIIAFPISIAGPHNDIGKKFENGLEGLANLTADPGVIKVNNSYIQLNGHQTLKREFAYASTPPAGFKGEWCNCLHEDYYIDMGNRKILNILIYSPTNTDPTFKTTTETIVSSFKFTGQNQTNTNLINTYQSPSGNYSFRYFTDWKLLAPTALNEGTVVEVQGPKQRLRITEGTNPLYGFDGFSVTNTTAVIGGKSFAARKFTSQDTGNSFLDVKIQDTPYQLYVQYGDATSVGFQGFNQQYTEKDDFTTDVAPLNQILQTFTYK